MIVYSLCLYDYIKAAKFMDINNYSIKNLTTGACEVSTLLAQFIKKKKGYSFMTRTRKNYNQYGITRSQTIDFKYVPSITPRQDSQIITQRYLKLKLIG